jgi:hypothetical protein
MPTMELHTERVLDALAAWELNRLGPKMDASGSDRLNAVSAYSWSPEAIADGGRLAGKSSWSCCV